MEANLFHKVRRENITNFHCESKTKMGIKSNVGVVKSGDDDGMGAISFIMPGSSVEEGNVANSVGDFYIVARVERIEDMYRNWNKACATQSIGLCSIMLKLAVLLLETGYIPVHIFFILPHLQGIHADLDWAKAAVCSRKQDRPVQPWHLFEKDRLTNRRFPFFIATIALLCLLLHIVRAGMNDWDFQDLGNSDSPLVEHFATASLGTMERSEYYRMITSAFLHSNVGHLASNMLAFYIFGVKLEKMYGSGTIAVIFLSSAIGGDMTMMVLDGVEGFIWRRVWLDRYALCQSMDKLGSDGRGARASRTSKCSTTVVVVYSIFP